MWKRNISVYVMLLLDYWVRLQYFFKLKEPQTSQEAESTKLVNLPRSEGILMSSNLSALKCYSANDNYRFKLTPLQPWC